MRATLQSWINDADRLRHLRFFSIAQMPIRLAHIANRPEDYYISLVGELFKRLGDSDALQSDWAQLGNAFLQFSTETSDGQLRTYGIAKDDAALFAAASFYFGDYPASACLTMRRGIRPADPKSLRAACFDFLARPTELRSQIAIDVRETLRVGDMPAIDRLVYALQIAERTALQEGPGEWISAALLKRLVSDFRQSNLRAVLPEGHLDFWSPLVQSLIARQPATWEFFPSQIDAIRRGLLSSNDSYSLQMPTGAGKTTLCETLLYWHLKSRPDEVAIMLVPFRSLASELKGTLVRRLNQLGIASRCIYGGTVPTGDEIHGLADVRAVIATPEALSGLLGADREFTRRISLVICDEGHLLDNGGRGIGLELLLARLRARPARPTRFVFMSAIVPNIEEINAWLGGYDQTVIRSAYRPAIAEFASLEPVGSGANMTIGLVMHPQEPLDRRYSIEQFLDRQDFNFRNAVTRRQNTYQFSSVKAQAIATARKVLPMGATAIFAANKRGGQGAIGIAESLVEQLKVDLPLQKPIDHARQDALQKPIAYLEAEYGTDWIGVQCVRIGAVLHHGDIPQESREVLEGLIRDQAVKLIICTSTLAEGVNLPIRTLVLYSVQRRRRDGVDNMLARDIKNLVGRAGRAGANTKGLVICANPEQWVFVEPVATQSAGEPVKGALLDLIERLTNALIRNNFVLSNEILENTLLIHPLVDGVDSTLIELLSDEIGEAEFIALATDLAAQTFASRQLPASAAANLRTIFALRAGRLFGMRASGKVSWAKDTGARVRLIDSVEQTLLPQRADWNATVDPLDEELRRVIFNWAWSHTELQESLRKCFRLDDNLSIEIIREKFFAIVTLWMQGTTFVLIAAQVELDIDDLLAIHTGGITYAFQTLVEQGVRLLDKRLESAGVEIADGVSNFPEHLRFGSPTTAARMLAQGGVRHRKAYVKLGQVIDVVDFVGDQNAAKRLARASLLEFAEGWRAALGDLVYQNTLADLSAA